MNHLEQSNIYDCVIVGAGASGLMCAYETSQRGKSVLLIDHRGNFAQKLLVSGGGRCNFTNLNLSADNYVSQNAKFVCSALSKFSPSDVMKLFEEFGVGYHEEDNGKMFLDKSTKELKEAFLRLLKKNNISIVIGKIKSINKDDNFEIVGGFGRFLSRKLVIATGGLSFVNLGSSDYGYKVAKAFGHSVVECHPALVPFLLSKNDQKDFTKLSGISFKGVVSIGERRFKGECLITHQGLSGPAILRVSTFWKKGEDVVIDFLPEVDLVKHLLKMKKQKPKRELKTILHEFIPERLVQFLCNRIYPSETSEKVSFYVIPLPPQGQALRSLPSRSRGAGIQKLRKRLDPRIREDDRQVVFQRFPSVPIQRISDKDIKNIDFAIHNFKIVPRSTAGYDKADVTLGGVETREISSQTMESKKCPGLYFIGEVLDVAGDLGGYNMHWAWASAYAAGTSI